MSRKDQIVEGEREIMMSSSPPSMLNFNTKRFSTNDPSNFSSSGGGGGPLSARDLAEKFDEMATTGSDGSGSGSGAADSGAQSQHLNTAEKRAKPSGARGAGSNSPPPIAHHGNEPFVIGVAGGTASGKTTVCREIIQRLSNQRVVIVEQDAFYRGLTKEEEANVSEYNFDHPDAFDKKALLECIEQLKKRQPVKIPVYDFTTHQRSETETKLVNPGEVVIIEGIMVLHMEEVRKALNMKIFVDTDDDLRLARRIKRDTVSRGRDVDNVIAQYTKFVKPMFDQFISPSKRFADVIIPCGRDVNHVAIDLITQHVHVKLDQKDLRRIYPNLYLINTSFQTKALHTIIRDKNTSKQDFVFYADRLIRIVVEAGLGCLPFAEKIVTTPTGKQYVGVDFGNKICGVSVIRSGESMENALRACANRIKLGKILIERNKGIHQDCALIYERLPSDIKDRHVLLMDPIVGTGYAVTSAIELLLSKGVKEGNIIVLSLIAVPEGMHRLLRKYPSVKLVTSEIDDGISDNYTVLPGIGNFGDRYFSG